MQGRLKVISNIRVTVRRRRDYCCGVSLLCKVAKDGKLQLSMNRNLPLLMVSKGYKGYSFRAVQSVLPWGISGKTGQLSYTSDNLAVELF